MNMHMNGCGCAGESRGSVELAVLSSNFSRYSKNNSMFSLSPAKSFKKRGSALSLEPSMNKMSNASSPTSPTSTSRQSMTPSHDRLPSVSDANQPNGRTSDLCVFFYFRHTGFLGCVSQSHFYIVNIPSL